MAGGTPHLSFPQMENSANRLDKEEGIERRTTAIAEHRELDASLSGGAGA